MLNCIFRSVDEQKREFIAFRKYVRFLFFLLSIKNLLFQSSRYVSDNPVSISQALINSKSISIFLSDLAQNFLLTTFAPMDVSTSLAAGDFTDRKQQGNWMVGDKALLLDPDVSSTVSIGGD